MSLLSVASLPLVTASLSSGTSAEELKRITTCIVKKDLSCIPREMQHLALDEALYLRSNLFNFKNWVDVNLRQIQFYLSQISSLETCLSQFGKKAPSLAKGYTDYFQNYLKDIKTEVKKIEELNTFANQDLNAEESKFIVTKLKNNFEKFKRDLDKTEESFREIVDRGSIKRMVDTMNSFGRTAIRFGTGKCNVKDLRSFSVTPLTLSKPIL